MRREKKRVNYYPFGLQHKGYNNVVTSTNPAKNYKYNGKELNEELGLDWYDYGARNYQADLGRWMNLDPAADEYVRWSPYNYAMNNPMFFIDPDGKRIKIGDGYYSYQEDRNYDDIEDDFERDVYKALDLLYSTSALELCIGGDSCDAESPSVLETLINDKDNTLTIKKGQTPGYDYRNNDLYFNPEEGTLFIKDATKPIDRDNIGYNSPTAILGHELIHGYNDIYDHTDYLNRRADLTTQGKIKTVNGDDVSYKNGEEKYTTTLSNQVNEKLKEDKRSNYGIQFYPVESVTSTKKKNK